jgi:NAD(P)-dependent dehydrogenase (short-subunit alcohol dehydrogenase family)
MDEESVVAGFEKARAAHGQERITVHCAMANRKGKTVGRNRETGEFVRFTTDDYQFGVNGILVASYRVASLSALGMAGLDPLEDGERGVITLTASVAAQDAQIGQVAYGSAKAGVNGLVLPMARDLMDFSMQGSFATIRFLTQVVPFFNARIQGLYKLGRAAKEDPARLGAVIGAAALMSVSLLLAFGNDDDWKKREDWDRNNYWWFKFGGTAFRIPKPPITA